MAYHFALVAHRSGLEAEVRLAGDAVDILKDGGIPDPGSSKRLLTYMNEAVETGLFVSVWPRCVDARAVSDDDIRRWGAVRRKLRDILTEVAEGSSELVYLG
jgi:sulfur relay (sulfurtransferase) complex TusBCD TusD component (DsrE family)